MHIVFSFHTLEKPNKSYRNFCLSSHRFFITQSSRVVNESQIRFFLLLVGYRCLSVLLTDVFLGASRENWCFDFSKTVLRIILEIKWGGSKPSYGVILEVVSHLFAVVVNDKFNKNIYDYINMFCLCLLGFFLV